MTTRAELVDFLRELARVRPEFSGHVSKSFRDEDCDKLLEAADMLMDDLGDSFECVTCGAILETATRLASHYLTSHRETL